MLTCFRKIILVLACSFPLLADMPMPSLRVGRAFQLATPLHLNYSHLSLDLENGMVARVMEGDQSIGIYWQGAGRFHYTSQDRMEFAAMATNLGKNSGYRPTNGGTIETLNGELAELFLLDPKAVASWGEGGTGPDLALPFAAFRKPFDEGQGTPLSHHILLQRGNGDLGKAIWAEFKGPKGVFRFVLDPAQTVTESLFLLRELSGPFKGTYPVQVSSQPLGWDRRKPITSPVVLYKVDLDVEASAKESVKVRATETYRTLVPGLRLLQLDLLSPDEDLLLRKGGRTPYRLRRVKDSEGKELPFDHRRGNVLVALPEPLKAGALLTLTFEMEGDLLIRPSGDNYWHLGVAPWFPMPDSLDGQFFTLAARISVPKPYTPFASGLTVSRESSGDRNILRVRMDTPTQFFIAHAGAYRVHEKTKDGVTVRIATYANEASDPSRLINLAFQIMEFYKRALGPFPYPEFNILQMNEWGYGQAPPATMLITNEAFQRVQEQDFVYTDEEGIPRVFSGFERAVKKGVNFRFAHEIAHQYWGHVVKMPNREEQWITESFADMSALLAIRQFRSKGESAYKGQISAWKIRAEQAKEASSIATANRLFTWPPQESSLKRQALIYDKGAYLLTHVQSKVGEGRFLNFLRTLLGTKGWNFATTQDVLDTLKATTGQDFTSLFEACYWGTSMPEDLK